MIMRAYDDNDLTLSRGTRCLKVERGSKAKVVGVLAARDLKFYLGQDGVGMVSAMIMAVVVVLQLPQL